MLKNEWIDKASEKSGLNRRDVKACYDAFEEAFLEALKAGEQVKIAGIGVFKVKERVASSLRNPKTNVLLPEQQVRNVNFAASLTLKEKINK